MSRYLPLFLLLAIIAGCNVTSHGASPPESARGAETAAGTKENTKATDSPATSSPVPEAAGKTVMEVADQSFDTNFESWGDVRFVTAERRAPERTELVLTLQDRGGNTLYTFPEPEFTKSWKFDSVKAVSFKDVDQDGLKDVIVVADYMSGVGEDGDNPFTVGSVFFQKDKTFVSDADTDLGLYELGHIESVNDVVTYFENKNFQDEINKQLCRKAIASSANGETLDGLYYDAYMKYKFDLSEYGQDRMYAVIGSCFQGETERLLAHDKKLKDETDVIYHTLVASIGVLSDMDYIRNGGGTMWVHNGNRETEFYHYHVYKYVLMKQAGATPSVQEYDKLTAVLDERMDTLKTLDIQGLEEFMEPDDVKEAKKQLQEDFVILSEQIQKFKTITVAKDSACLYLLNLLTENVVPDGIH